MGGWRRRRINKEESSNNSLKEGRKEGRESEACCGNFERKVVGVNSRRSSEKKRMTHF